MTNGPKAEAAHRSDLPQAWNGPADSPSNVLRLERRDLARCFGAVAVINTLVMVASYFARSDAGHWRLRFLLDQANLGHENNLGAWYSSMLLLAVGAAMLVAFAVDAEVGRQEGGSDSGRSLMRYGWLFLAFIFAGLSWDELGSFHERLPEIPAALIFLRPVADFNAWVSVLAVPIAVVALMMLAFGWIHVRRSAAAFGLMGIGILLFASLPVHEHIEVGLKIASGDPESYIRPASHAVFEEGSEVFGSLAFLSAALIYARHRASSLPGRSFRVLPGPRHVLVWALLMIGALLFVYLNIPHLMYLGDHRGVPQNWPPSASAALVSALCVLMMTIRRSGKLDPLTLALTIVAFIHIVLSLGHATEHVWFTLWLRLGPDATALVRDLVAAGLATTGLVLLWRQGAGVLPRAMLLAWAALLGLSFVGRDPVAVPLAVAAYLALLLGLATMGQGAAHGPAEEAAPGTARPRSVAASG